MFIHYKLYRSKNTNEVFDEGKIQFNIINDDYLIAFDDILTKVMSDYINSTPEVKKYGIAYVDRLEIMYLEITDDDVIDLGETEFLNYMKSVVPNMKFVWNRKSFDPTLK